MSDNALTIGELATQPIASSRAHTRPSLDENTPILPAFRRFLKGDVPNPSFSIYFML